MSEASNAWRVTVGDVEHDVEVDHSTMTGKIILKLDGAVIDDDRMLARKKPLEFDIDGHPAVATVELAYGGLAARSTLHLDGRYVEPLTR